MRSTALSFSIALLASTQLGCSGGMDGDVHVDAALSGRVALVSAPQLGPSERNRLEATFDLANVSSTAQRVRCQVSWFDGSGNQRGGQTQELHLQPQQSLTVRAPTNDTKVERYAIALSALDGATASGPAPGVADGTLQIHAPTGGASGTGTLSLSVASVSEIRYSFVIDDDACGDFKFTPGGRCATAEQTLQKGATSTILVAFRPHSGKSRHGRMRVVFGDGSRPDIEVPLRGEIGAGEKGRVSLQL